MNLKNIVLTKGSQTQKATYCMVLYIGNVQNRQIETETEERLVISRSLWEEGMGSDCKWIWVFAGVGSGGVDNVLELDSGDSYTTL